MGDRRGQFSDGGDPRHMGKFLAMPLKLFYHQTKSFFRPLALGNVQDHAHSVQTARFADRFASRHNPAFPTVARNNAKLAFKRYPGQLSALDVVGDSRSVVRVNVHQEIIQLERFILTKTKSSPEMRINPNLAFFEITRPQPQLAGVGGKLHHLLAFSQLRLDPPQLSALSKQIENYRRLQSDND